MPMPRTSSSRTARGGARDRQGGLKRELDCYTARRDTPQVLEVPDLQYLMLDGHGDPNTPLYAAAVSALYPVAYKLSSPARTTSAVTTW